MEFRVLGPVECVLAGRPLDLGRPQERCLLAVLLLDLGRVVPVDRLIELLWDGEPPARARSIVHTHVSRLRATLRGAGADRYGVRLLTRGRGYLIEAPGQTVDAHRFRRLIEQAGQAGDPAARAAALRDALALWRGPALSDVATERVREQICAGLDEQRVAALEERAEADLAAGRHRELVTELTDLAARYPLRERLVGLLMLALYRSGQQARALSAYRETRRRLVDELGIEPGGELRQLEQAVLTQDPALDAPPAGPGPDTAGAGRVSGFLAGAPPARPDAGRPAPPGGGPAAGLGPVPDRRWPHTAWHGPRSRLTSIVGRHAESSTLAALLTDHRLVTVVGVGGVGKTTLALHAAEAVGPALRRDVIVVTLAPVRTEDEIIFSISNLLGVGSTTVAEAMAGVERFLRDRAHLLVLDNCEHLTGPCVRVVRGLLAASPRLVVLATSREPLGLPEETVWRLEPLRVPAENAVPQADVPAVALFLRRGAEALPGFAPAGAELAAVGRICRRVDGLPLALELAASRLHTLPVQALADHLEHGFALLAGTGRDDPLAATLDWSYRLLSEAERRLLARLSVFRGGFDAVAAERVCDRGPLAAAQIRPILAALVERSLVQPYDAGGARRYRLLEVVRDYAATRLSASGERPEITGAHLDHWLETVRAVAARPLFDDQVDGWVALRADLDNLRAAVEDGYATGRASDAVELTVLLFDFWSLQETHFAELERWLERAAPHLSRCPPQVRCLAQVDGAMLHTLRDDYAAALAMIRPALPELQVHHPAMSLEARITEVRAMIRLLDPAALPAAGELFTALASAGDPHYRLHGVAMLAEAQLTWGRYAEAAELCAEHGPQEVPAGPFDTIRYLAVTCLAELGRGAHERAGATEARLSALLDRPGNFLHLSTPRRAMALRALTTGPPGRAVVVIADIVRELAERYPSTMSRAYGFLILLAEARRRAGQLDQALLDLTEGLTASASRQDYTQILPGVICAALLAADLGNPAACKDLGQRWDVQRRRLGLPAPLGFAEPVADCLGLDPAAPDGPAAGYRWDEHHLRDLVQPAHRWCVGHQELTVN